ncbi:hypothetical protein R6Q59_008307 [Mikania micrantha]
MRHVKSRYLRPSTGSCHDRCKNGMKDESELKKPTRRFRVRKILVKKNKVKRSIESVERNKFTKTKTKPSTGAKIKQESSSSSKRIGVSVHGSLINRKSAQNEFKLTKNNVKAKPVSSSILNGQKDKKEVKNVKKTGTVSKSTYVEQVTSKATHTCSSPGNHKPVSLNDEHSMTKTELKQFIAGKITEMTLQEAENAELELVPLTVEIESPLKDEHGMIKTELKQLIAKITEMNLHESENAELEFFPLTVDIESPPDVTKESIDLPCSESFQYSSDKQVSIEERENAYIASEDEYEIIICKDKENGGSKVKFMRGRVVEVELEDDGPRRLRFRRGKILMDNEDGPIRLKFRRGKILGINEEDGPRRHKFRFRKGKILEDNEDDVPTCLKFRRGKILEDEEEQSIAKINLKEKIVEEATDDSKNKSETVTLKHQEMQEKKEAQELLNRLIEETASKLEVDRKTKVEALVGAFESVISLQDDASSSQ